MTAISQIAAALDAARHDAAVHHQLQRVDVPILQLALSGKGLSEQQLFDFGINFIRTQLATVQGAAIPYPYGGKQRQIQVDLDLRRAAGEGPVAGRRRQRDQRAEPDPALAARRRSATEYDVELNSSPTTIEELNDLPIKTVERHDDLHPRRRARARRLPAADQHRARRRPARRRC